MRQDLLLLGRYKQRFTHSFLLPKQLQINILHYLKNDFNFNEQIHIKIIFLSTNIEAIYIVIQTCKCYTEIPHSWVLFLFVNPAYVIGENVKVQESSRRFNMQANQKEKGARQSCPILTHFLQKAIKDSQSWTSSCKKSNVVSYLHLKFYIQYTFAFINFVCNRGRCWNLQCVIYHIPQPIRLSHTQALDLLTMITVSP